MIAKLREEFDADRIEEKIGATRLKTRENPHQVNCASCGEAYFVDRAMFDSISQAIVKGLDNPFVCDRCETEYEEVAH